MHLVEQHRLDRHAPRWAAIDVATCASTNLYNAALYLTRQASIKDHTVISYTALDTLMPPAEQYRVLPATVAPWVLKQVCLAWTSDFAACRAWEEHPETFLGHPKLPNYLPKPGRNLLTYTTYTTYTTQAISRNPKNAGWIVPSGLPVRVATEHPVETIDQVRIVPHATHDTLEVICEPAITPADVDPQWVAGLDLGVNNRAAVPSNQPGVVPLLVHGRPLKAVNQLYNKQRAHCQALLPEGQDTSRRLDHLTDRRKRRVDSYLPVASRRIVDQLVRSRIGSLVIGKNDGWQQKVGRGKRTNQTFVFLPHARFIQMLTYQAQLVGIQVTLTEESYTSKCRFLDEEPLTHQATYAGKRVKRGRFMTVTGRRLNADVNGAYNMIVKVVPDAFGTGRAGVVVHPVRLTLANRRLAS